MEELNTFLDNWTDTDTRTREAFLILKEHIMAMEDVVIDFIARPGVSYSLRPKHPNQNDRSLFAMADVIDDDPEARWLSVCFYGDMITDPEEMGDLIPGGLLGQDGYCFDLDEFDPDDIEYLKERLTEAFQAARG